jgi:cyclopropane-fatty-acyl-phospholipid synthase
MEPTMSPATGLPTKTTINSASERGERNRFGAGTPAYEVVYENGGSFVKGEGHPAFTFLVKNSRHLDHLLHADPYSAAMSFVRGDFEIEGDIVAAIRFKTTLTRPGVRGLLAGLAARFSPSRLDSWLQTSSQATRNIRFHYDRSNDFYSSFLDSRMVYSCAYFKDFGQSLDDAQLAKLDHICRKLDIRPEDRFLDVGCGWGALVVRAAEKYGALALGCTLSFQQTQFAAKTIAEHALEGRAAVRAVDYRRLRGPFRKIASVGMFEHVGRRRLGQYFRTISGMLDDDGLFLNHGIIRPVEVTDGPETLFLQRKVFPGGELVHLPLMIREAERAGFEVLDVENLRPHYAETCRRWVDRLQRNAQACITAAGGETYRTWLLYLAGSAVSFERGVTDIYQVLFAKRKAPQARHLTRDYIYAGAGG